MKLNEVSRPSDRAAERSKIAAKEEAMRNRVVSAYVRGLTAPQFKPHAVDVEEWMFDKDPRDTEAMKELEVWVDAIGFMVGAKPSDKMSDSHEKDFRVFSHFLDIPHEFVDFVCSGGDIPA